MSVTASNNSNTFLNDFINRLPNDIIMYNIIPYTYNLQNKNLLNDIINYKETQTILFEYYHNVWIIYMEYPTETLEDKYWLINDLFLFMNDNKASMVGYVEKFYNIFKRNMYLQTNEDVDRYVNKLEQKQVISQINICLSLLNITERQEFMLQYVSNYV